MAHFCQPVMADEPGTKDGEEKISKLAKRLKLSEDNTGEQIRNNNVLILQHNAGTSD